MCGRVVSGRVVGQVSWWLRHPGKRTNTVRGRGAMRCGTIDVPDLAREMAQCSCTFIGPPSNSPARISEFHHRLRAVKGWVQLRPRRRHDSQHVHVVDQQPGTHRSWSRSTKRDVCVCEVRHGIVLLTSALVVVTLGHRDGDVREQGTERCSVVCECVVGRGMLSDEATWYFGEVPSDAVL